MKKIDSKTIIKLIFDQKALKEIAKYDKPLARGLEIAMYLGISYIIAGLTGADLTINGLISTMSIPILAYLGKKVRDLK